MAMGYDRVRWRTMIVLAGDDNVWWGTMMVATGNYGAS